MSHQQGVTRQEVTISAVVTRADGTVEDLGVVSYWHANPLKRLLWRINQVRRAKCSGSQ